MKPGHYCLPCLIRQATETARFITSDDERFNSIMKEVFLSLHESDLSMCPPLLSQAVHRAVRRVTGDADPYREHKKRFNDLALSILPELTSRVEKSADPFADAVRISIAGNVIDMGITWNLTEKQIITAMDRRMKEPFQGSISEMKIRLANARNVLFLADNSGEIIFDTLLLRHIDVRDITVAVRGYPILNDATMDDAMLAGLDSFARVISNGSDAPGTILEDCSEEFRRVFNNADVIIAKGQGNYESLCDVKRDIFFLLKIKCEYLANHCGFEIGTHTIIRTCRP